VTVKRREACGCCASPRTHLEAPPLYSITVPSVGQLSARGEGEAVGGVPRGGPAVEAEQRDERGAEAHRVRHARLPIASRTWPRTSSCCMRVLASGIGLFHQVCVRTGGVQLGHAARSVGRALERRRFSA